MRNFLTYAVFILGVVAIGTSIGLITLPGMWYTGLEKPWFTPPNWVFGPVWTTLYVLIGWVGARKWLYGGAGGLWWAQMAANFLWSPVFFALQMPLAGLAVIIVMWLLIAAFIVKEQHSDRLSAALFLPYLAWVSLATALNVGIVVLN
ncbi:tryptophan-rich sensory protein [Pseudorhodobacter turbinis]|uniref:Tryptophan-rich sensory protein n=1 Tax=Pseudorhodobacter turbinis TaxID=2500533 RepID=A0A4P8EFC5_9RHOB|nr:TspO/MBR family protein [Pseudorhodobacter turbinis]QCO55790.1 tryptophan-rich sensory protein [Pseudorhodobacter turbinis]